MISNLRPLQLKAYDIVIKNSSFADALDMPTTGTFSYLWRWHRKIKSYWSICQFFSKILYGSIIVTAPRILGATIVVIDEISLTSLEDFYNIHNKTTFHLNWCQSSQL